MGEGEEAGVAVAEGGEGAVEGDRPHDSRKAVLMATIGHNRSVCTLRHGHAFVILNCSGPALPYQ